MRLSVKLCVSDLLPDERVETLSHFGLPLVLIQCPLLTNTLCSTYQLMLIVINSNYTWMETLMETHKYTEAPAGFAYDSYQLSLNKNKSACLPWEQAALELSIEEAG